MTATRNPRRTIEARPKRAFRSGLAGPAEAINEVISEAGAGSTKASREPRDKSQSPPKPRPKTREGKKGLVVYVDPEVTKALRKLAANHDTDQQTLALRGLELLFEEYGMALPRSPDKTADTC